MFVIGILRFISLALRLLGSGFRYLGALLTQLYDLPLFIPLWWASRESQTAKPGGGGLAEGRSGKDLDSSRHA